MPSKTPEAKRDQVLALLKQGKSYSAIQKETGLSGPVVYKIKKEAGLLRSTAPASAPPASALPTATPTAVSASGNGLSEFQPEALRMPKKATEEPAKKQHMRCTNCGELFTFDDPKEIPEICPECGA